MCIFVGTVSKLTSPEIMCVTVHCTDGYLFPLGFRSYLCRLIISIKCFAFSCQWNKLRYVIISDLLCVSLLIVALLAERTFSNILAQSMGI